MTNDNTLQPEAIEFARFIGGRREDQVKSSNSRLSCEGNVGASLQKCVAHDFDVSVTGQARFIEQDKEGVRRGVIPPR